MITHIVCFHGERRKISLSLVKKLCINRSYNYAIYEQLRARSDSTSGHSNQDLCSLSVCSRASTDSVSRQYKP